MNYENLGAQLPDIGTMNERVTLQSYSVIRDANGAAIPTYSDLATVWARVEPANIGNSESLTADQTMVFTRVKVTIRFRTDVSENMRVVYNDGIEYKSLDILFKSVLGQRRFLTLTCEHRK